MEVVLAGPSHEKKTDTKLEREEDGIIEISDSDPSTQGVVPGTSNDSMRAPFKNLSNNSPNAKKAQKKITSFYTKKEAPKKRKKEK